MQKLLFSIIMCMLAFPLQAEEMSLEDTIAEVNSSVVGIVVSHGDTQALGSGIIVSADGYVVTNSHVTEDEGDITVITADDEEYSAKLIGSDAKTDIALLKVNNPQDFKPAEFADSDLVRAGNSVFAIGNPFGLGNSVSLGIISAKERDIEKGPYDNFLQTDTAINQGNSGGPLFNTEGEIVGMNTAIFSTDGNNMGVGFSTPSNVVQWVVAQLKSTGKVTRGWLGVGVQKVRTIDEMQKNKLAVASMAEGSPAELAGIKVGDVLLSVEDIELSNPRLFSLSVSKIKPGTKLAIKLLRDGKVVETELQVAAMPDEKVVLQPMTTDTVAALESRGGHYVEELGLHVDFDERNNEVLVLSVDDDSDASIKGIRSGDRLKSIDGRKIFGLEDLSVKLKEAKSKQQVILQFIGDDGVDTITLKLKDSQ